MDLDLKNLRLTLWYIQLRLEKYLNYFTGLGLILWYVGVRLENYSDYYTILDLNWFYDILDLDLKNSRTKLLNSDLFYYNRAEMPLEKFEILLEFSVNQLLIQSSLASLVFLDQTMCCVWKTKMLMLFVEKLDIFRIQKELFKSKSNLILFKR